MKKYQIIKGDWIEKRNVDRYSNIKVENIKDDKYYRVYQKTIKPRNGNPEFSVTVIDSEIQDKKTIVENVSSYCYYYSNIDGNDEFVKGSKEKNKYSMFIEDDERFKLYLNIDGKVIAWDRDENYQKLVKRFSIYKNTIDKLEINLKKLKEIFPEKLAGKLVKISDYPLLTERIKLLGNKSLYYLRPKYTKSEYMLFSLEDYYLLDMSYLSFYPNRFVTNGEEKNQKMIQWVEKIINGEKEPDMITYAGIKIWKDISKFDIQAMEYPDGSLKILPGDWISMTGKSNNWSYHGVIRDGGEIEKYNKILSKEIKNAGAGKNSSEPGYEKLRDDFRKVFYNKEDEWNYYSAAWYGSSYGDAENRRSGVES